jgi:hypothetical protein
MSCEQLEGEAAEAAPIVVSYKVSENLQLLQTLNRNAESFEY